MQVFVNIGRKWEQIMRLQGREEKSLCVDPFHLSIQTSNAFVYLSNN